ncbi:RING finger protein nhl-1-like [Wyeomyia smithii]|uniref:RING finger protein nhl-1-like n=1 Tax=Wyeomyia smithii TaxID=174621 RepID=UPI0024681344|nr:RING finger protein nhl-1-like [Wyeomyia smithii]
MAKNLPPSGQSVNYESDSKQVTSTQKPLTQRSLSTSGGSPSEDSMRALENLIICTICQNRLRSPKMLQCQHTFCLACLKMSIQRPDQQDYIVCPTCDSMQELSTVSGDISKLPPNLYIDSVMQVLDGQQQVPVYREQQHTLSLASTVKSTSGEPHSKCYKCDTFGSVMMQNCDHCKQILCAICWQTHMDELAKQVRQLDVQLNSASEKMENKVTVYRSRFNDINLQIKEYFEEQISILQSSECSLLDESQRILNDGLCSHELVMEKIRHLRATIGDTAIGTHGNLVQLFLNLHKEISIVFEEISHWGKEIILFDQQTMKIEVLNARNDAKSQNETSKESENQKVGALSKETLNTQEDVLMFYRNHFFKPKLFWNKCHRPAGVGLAPWKHPSIDQPLIYIAGAESKVVFVVNKANGEIVQRILHDNMVYPNGVAFDATSKTVYVSDKWKHCIFVFAATGEFLRQLCDKGDQEGYLRSPGGLVVGPNDSLFICDTGNDRIQCINATTGRMLSQFGRIPKEQLLKATQTKVPTRHVDLKSPTGIAIHNDTVVVLDSGNRRIKTFNKRGEKVLEFGQTGSMTGQFQYPEVIAVDSHGFILVGDGGNAKILIFRPNGQFITALGSRGDSPGKFNWLSGLAVTEDREIIISDYRNHSVQVIV